LVRVRLLRFFAAKMVAVELKLLLVGVSPHRRRAARLGVVSGLHN
jgi:hypothetical protein